MVKCPIKFAPKEIITGLPAQRLLAPPGPFTSYKLFLEFFFLEYDGRNRAFETSEPFHQSLVRQIFYSAI